MLTHVHSCVCVFYAYLYNMILHGYGLYAASNSKIVQVRETPYTRLCETKKILTVNGQYPGPTIHVHKGETIVVDVYNMGNYNITLHWYLKYNADIFDLNFLCFPQFHVN